MDPLLGAVASSKQRNNNDAALSSHLTTSVVPVQSISIIMDHENNCLGIMLHVP